MKRWMQKRTKVNIQKMAKALNIQEATACVLANRGIATYQEALQFLQKVPMVIEKPDSMKDFKKGIQLIQKAILQEKSMVVYGDYDVDGVMSTTILYKTLKHCGGNVTYYIPHRQQEGYGLNQEIIKKFLEQGIELLITCDNGIAAIEEIALAKQLGLTVLVLDHHEPAFQMEEGEKKEILPIADAIIDPKQKDCNYPFSVFCAAGISYKFSCALMMAEKCLNKKIQRELLVLASIATVCDIVDLVGENRNIVQKGLKYSNLSGNLGLDMLLEESGLAGKTLTEYHFGFVIGPCINAVGRLESAKTAVSLFCEEDREQARNLAKKLVFLNEKRKEMTREATEEALETIYNTEINQDKVLVLFQEDIHESVAGIVAGRIKEECYKPVVVLTKGEDMAKGSARSIEGYNIFEELLACNDLFQRFGGHAMAAGLSMPQEEIPTLRKRLNDACVLTEQDMIPVIKIEKQLSFSEINITLAQEIQTISPFGKGNPKPVFGSKKIRIERFFLIGKEKNMLRMELREEKTGLRHMAIAFEGFEKFCSFIKELYPLGDCDKILKDGTCDMVIDFVYHLDINQYQGMNSVQLIVKDFRLSNKENG